MIRNMLLIAKHYLTSHEDILTSGNHKGRRGGGVEGALLGSWHMPLISTRGLYKFQYLIVN